MMSNKKLETKKKYRVYQTISIFVEAKNEVEAVEKVRSNEDTYNGWDKWDVECDSIIDFYPYINEEEEGNDK